MTRAKNVFLLAAFAFVLLAVCAGIFWFQSFRTREQPQSKTASFSERNNGVMTASDLQLGLLKPLIVKGSDGKAPPEALSRYIEIDKSFFAGQSYIEPEVNADAEGGVPLCILKGRIWLVFQRNTGRITRIMEARAFFDIEMANGETTSLVELSDQERAELEPRLEAELSSRLGVGMGASVHVESVKKQVYHGRLLCTAVWLMQYNGYRHLHDGFNASFELREGSPYLYCIGSFGSKQAPEKGRVLLSAEQAREIALNALTKFYDVVRQRNVNCDFVGSRVIDHDIAYAYRNDLFVSAKTFAGGWQETRQLCETHLCYIVRVIGAPKALPAKTNMRPEVVEVFVDAQNGSVVGGEY